MMPLDLQAWAREIADRQNFTIDKLLYEATHRQTEQTRNVIYDGRLAGKPAVLKVYNDRRVSREPEMQKLYREQYATDTLTAPEVFAHAIVSPHRGWLIMERLPYEGHFFKSPITAEERKKILDLFIAYRTHFPRQAPQTMMPFEELPAPLFTRIRIDRWFIMANDAEAELIFKGEKPLLHSTDFLPRFEKSLALLEKANQDRPMIWCHGHFKPKELFYHPKENKYYLTDFGHMHLYPEGYELGFMIWADWLMAADWRLPYAQWRQGIDAWLNDLEPIAQSVGFQNHHGIVTTSLIERCLGALLADVVATDKSREEKEVMITLLYRLMDELIG